MSGKQAVVYPACAGIYPQADTNKEMVESLPRMRGDLPRFRFVGDRRIVSTPHARGSTLAEAFWAVHFVVYPACAGIYLEERNEYFAQVGLPRMRGDLPVVLERRAR